MTSVLKSLDMKIVDNLKQSAIKDMKKRKVDTRKSKALFYLSMFTILTVVLLISMLLSI
jgi:hypothetical protein